MTRHVAIVIPTADTRGKNATRCLRAIKETTGHLDVSVHPVVSTGDDFRFSRSINEGISRAAAADAWVLLNDDAFMDPGWLDAMLDAADAHPAVGVWGGVLRYSSSAVQFAGGELPLTPLEFVAAGVKRRAPFWALRELAKHRFTRRAYMFHHYDRVRPTHRLDFVTGACYFITRACHERVGGFDERYAFGAEDVDHSLRCLEAGFELGLATRATGVHLDGGSGQHYSAKQLESVRIFHETWAGERIAKATRRGGRKGVYHPPPRERA